MTTTPKDLADAPDWPTPDMTMPSITGSGLYYRHETVAIRDQRWQAVVNRANERLDALKAENEALRAEKERTERNRDMWKGQCDTQAEQLTGLRKDMPPHGVVISGYRIGAGLIPITVQRSQQIDGPDKWAVRRGGDCLNKAGAWEWEPMPSSRDDEFLAHCRFDSHIEAIAAAMAQKGAA